MKNLIIAFMPLIFFIRCEDDDGTADGPLVGTWNYVATNYDETCSGNGEVFMEGTMVFTDTDLLQQSNLTFEMFCSREEGTLINDTLCVWEDYGDTLTLNWFLEDCEDEELTINDNGDGCIDISEPVSYTYSDSLYLTYMTVEYDAHEEYCLSEDGETFNANDSTCTYTDTDVIHLIVDGNTATINAVYIDEDDSENSFCNVFALTKQ